MISNLNFDIFKYKILIIHHYNTIICILGAYIKVRHLLDRQVTKMLMVLELNSS